MKKNHRLASFGTVLVSILILITLSVTSHAGEQFKGPVRFAVIGDRTGGHSPGVYKEIITEIERLRPDFTMTVGDMIEGYTDDVAQVRAQWKEYLSLLKPLSAPIYHTPGNHDIWGADNEAPYRLYEKNIGPVNYAFSHCGVYIVVMENGRWEGNGELPPEKIKWLEKMLQQGKDAPYTLVFLHKPFWFESLAQGKPDPLHMLFKQYGVDAVFTGHYHLYFSGKYDGILYTSMGSSGGSAYSKLTGFKYHFAWVTIDDKAIHIAPIKNESILPHDVMTADDLIMAKRIISDAWRAKSAIEVGDDLTVQPSPCPFTIKNPHDSLPVDGVLKWKIPEGWRLEPASIPVQLKPGEERTVNVQAACHGPLYPAPRFSLKMPFKAERTYTLKRGLWFKRRAVCTRAESPIVIDGIVDEKELRKKGETVFFSKKKKGVVKKDDDFVFHLSYDDNYLYVSAICREQESETRLTGNRKRDQKTILRDDHIGLLLAPPKQSGKEYRSYKIMVNPDGSVFDQELIETGVHESIRRTDWDVEALIATRQEERAWFVEMRMPLAQFGVDRITPNESWGINIRRKQSDPRRVENWMLPFAGGRYYMGSLYMGPLPR
ncbi:metallophosphoesterase [Dethiosulfatarculus sandiegensis]|uniref:Calcineurin-like phosphoesterase domain-containing protein n=1 Tax=Dethiosulfatarculus sandiegensis TaxID=1429043 RepID=A0A0D2HWG7_9BACT|nr:metallophosphoesterase [Dethiosulfatarculus sandiegensis]KIX14718.1 hypothetical protein X474_06145 [Dethiosulfatarculus sandiegensis]